jgi:hypothetical protein
LSVLKGEVKEEAMVEAKGVARAAVTVAGWVAEAMEVGAEVEATEEVKADP